MIRARSLLVLAIGLGVVASSRPASARGPETASERAAAIFREGQEAFAHKSYAAAAAAFEQAAQLAPHPAAWLDAAEAWELDGALPRAAEDCDRALALPDVAESHRREAEARLARLVSKIATLDLRTTRAQIVRVDGAAEVRAPGKLRIAPGHHAIAVLDLAGAPARSVAIEASRGETTSVDLDLPAPAPPVASPPSEPSAADASASPSSASSPARRGPPPAAWLAFGVAAIGAGTAIVTGAMTLSARTDFTNAPTFDARDRFYRLRTLTNVAWGVAGVAAATGAVLWITAPRTEAGPSVALVVQGPAVLLAHETRF
jgi:hypothetical protein